MISIWWIPLILFVSVLVGLSASKVQSAKDYADVKGENERLKAELENARKIKLDLTDLRIKTIKMRWLE